MNLNFNFQKPRNHANNSNLEPAFLFFHFHLKSLAGRGVTF